MSEVVQLIDLLVTKDIITEQDRENILYGEFARNLGGSNESR